MARRCRPDLTMPPLPHGVISLPMAVRRRTSVPSVALRLRLRCAALTTLSVFVLCAISLAAPRRILPVDEAPSRPDFFTFRAQLQAAVARHDAVALMAVVHPDIKCDFGGGEGKAFFEDFWKPGTAGSRVWAELGTVLALGGTFSSADAFVAPYVFSRWPESVDSFEHVAVVGDRVRIRTSPNAEADAAGVTSFEILPVARPTAETPEEWTAVALSPTKVGYIASHLVRSPIAYRAFFAKRDGRWQMLMFLAGD